MNDERLDLAKLVQVMKSYRFRTYTIEHIIAVADVVTELARREIEREESLLATTEADNG